MIFISLPSVALEKETSGDFLEREGASGETVGFLETNINIFEIHKF